MNLEEMKEVDLLTLENVKNHIKETLLLNEQDKIEYLKYAIDTYYKNENEGENNENIITYFSEEKFKPIYLLLMEEVDD